MRASSCVLVCLLASNLFLGAKEPKETEKVGSVEELFDLTKVGHVLLTLSPEDWKEIKPEEPARPGGPGGPGAFGPGGFLAQVVLQQFDPDKTGELSREQFVEGFARWFAAWDTKQTGFLDGEAMRDGMNKDFHPTPGPGPGGASGSGPGGPVGPRPPGGGGGPGLQAADGKRNGISGMTGIDFKYVHADLKFDGRKFPDVAVRYKGNGTYMDARDSEKKSFKVELNEFTKGQKLFGLTKLNFHSNITDPGWMNETMAYALYRDAGVPAPRSSYVRLAVNVPGTFDRRSLGLYTFVENPDMNWAKFHFNTKKGLILKPVTHELFLDQGPDWDAYAQAYDAKTPISDEQVARVVDFAKLVTNASDEDFAAQLPEYLDIDEFSRFMAVTVWLSSTDSILMMGQNYIVYLHPETNQFLFVPWDLDRTFGNFFFPQPEELSVRKAWGADNRFLTRVMKVPAMQKAYLARLAEFQETLFQPERLNGRIDEIAKLIRPAVAEEGADKLTRFDRAVAEHAGAEPPAAEQTGQPGFRMPDARPIKDFIKARHQSVADQLAGKSEGREIGGGGFGGPPGSPPGSPPGGPRNGANGGGPGNNGGGGTGGPNGPGSGGPGGGSPGGPRFGIGNFLGPVFVKAADTDADGHVTVAEFQALATRWFGEWNTDGTGKLNAEQLRNGFSKLLPPPPGFGGPPPGGPGGPGAPTPPGGR